jgi:hypothetical protein
MKNYVTEFDSQEVPTGSKYYSKADINQTSYFYSDEFEPIGNKSAFVIHLSDLKELPEVEWQPAAGKECRVNLSNDCNSGLSATEIGTDGSVVNVLASVTNKSGFKVTVFEVEDGGVYCFNSKLFSPAKSAKDFARDEFVAHAKVINKSLGIGVDISGFLSALFDEGFTAPEESE